MNRLHMDLYNYYQGSEPLLGQESADLLPFRIIKRLQRNRSKRASAMERLALARDSVSALDYALLTRSRFPEGEAVIAQDPETAIAYALNVLRGPWPLAEAVIAQNPESAYLYAAKIIRKRWPRGEAAIAQESHYAIKYALDILNARFPRGEAVIAQDPWNALAYAQYGMHAPWPKAEPNIFKDALARAVYLSAFPSRRTR